jgi:hypothetical protein
MKRPVLFLTDNDIWNSKRGTELVKYSGCDGDYCGHGSIMRFYSLKSDSGEHIEHTDLSNPKAFPKDIQKAIKEMKMVRISLGDSNWKALSALLNDKTIESLSPKEKADIDNINFIKKLHIVRGQKKLGKEVKEKLIRIFKTGEAYAGRRCGGKTICCYFSWSLTKEGQDYWDKIDCMKIFKEIKIPNISKNSPDCIDYRQMNKKIWELFKYAKNRNPLWI